MILDGGAVDIGLESTILDMTVEPPMILRPGAITADMFEEVIGPVSVDETLVNSESKQAPKAPGMRQLAYAAHREGKEVGIIATGETVQFYNYGIVKNIGTRENENTIARNLYRVLREFDEEDVDLIYSESFAMNGIGKAIMNRLEKAAGHMHLQATEITKKQKYRRVIFVSEADSAVGPMAAELLCHQDLEQEYIIESGGLVVLFPEPVNQKAEAIMKSAQMTLENHVSKQFDGSNLQGDTLVLTLNETIKNKVLSDYENVKNVYTINEFVGVSEELPNPYGKPLTAYGECFEILTGLIDKLADKLNSYAKGEE